jgi:hypothetical protein
VGAQQSNGNFVGRADAEVTSCRYWNCAFRIHQPRWLLGSSTTAQ